jgi:hypothetical protein
MVEINQTLSIGIMLIGVGLLFWGLGAFFKGLAKFVSADQDGRKGFFKRK